MKKIIFLLLIFMLCPLYVFAFGGNDDKTKDAKDKLIYQECIYTVEFNDEVAGMPHSYREIYRFKFPATSGTKGASLRGEELVFEVQQQVNGGEVFTVYNSPDFTSSSSSIEGNHILNWSNDHGTAFSLTAFMSHFHEENSYTQEQLDDALAKGTFCPESVYAINDYLTHEYKFMFCDGSDNGTGTDSCVKAKQYIESRAKDSGSGLVSNKDLYKLSFANLNMHFQASYDAGLEEGMLEDVKDQQEELQDKLDKYCDQNSPFYSYQDCNYLKGVGADALADMSTYAGITDALLEKIDYGKVTCATIFGTGSYNETHRLLSTCIKFIQYLAIVLALVLSIIDYIKVIPTNDKDALMKTTKNSAIRLGIAIAIFLVPALLKFVLKLLGITNAFCGLI